MLREKADSEMKREVLVDRRVGASLTYNGGSGVLKRVVIPPLPAGENWIEHVCRMLLPLPAVSEVCAGCCARVEQTVKPHKLSRWSCSIDVCPESVPCVRQVAGGAERVMCEELRLHGHAWLEASQAFSLHFQARHLVSRGSGPRCSDEQYAGLVGRCRGDKTAVAAGRYHCQCPRLSRVWWASSRCVYATHGLKAEWVTS